MTSSAAWSIAVVSSPPRPSPTTGLALGARGHPREHGVDVRNGARQSSSHSVKRSNSKAGRELRVEERALLRHHLTATCGRPRRPRCGSGRSRTGRLRLAAGRPWATGLLAARRVRDTRRCESVDDLRIEKPVLGRAARSVPPGRAPGPGGARGGRRSACPKRRRRSARPCVSGKIVSPSCPVGTITARSQADASLPSSSWERERGLVAVMAVRRSGSCASASSSTSASENSSSSRQSRDTTPPSSPPARARRGRRPRPCRPRGRRAARAGCGSHEAAAAAPPSARHACARAAGRPGCRTARAEAPRRAPSRRRATPSGPTYSCASHQHAGSGSRTRTPCSCHSARLAAASSSESGSVR
jgi:hypothetical protein